MPSTGFVSFWELLFLVYLLIGFSILLHFQVRPRSMDGSSPDWVSNHS